MSELLGKIFGKDHKDHKSSKDKDKSQQGQDKGATGKWPDFCKYPVVYVLDIISPRAFGEKSGDLLTNQF